MEQNTLLKQAMQYLREHTTYPDWWFKELNAKRLIAIYYQTKKTVSNQKKEVQR